MARDLGKPYSNTRLVRYLQKRVLELRPRKTQAAIAAESGFRQPNMLAMIKRGSTRLPLDRVPGLAKALECDPAQLFQMALEQSGYDTTELAVRKVFGSVVTQNERAWLDEIRDASGNSDPNLTSKARAAIRAIFGR